MKNRAWMLAALCLLSLPAYADKQHDLSAITQKITTLKEHLLSNKSKQDKISKQLETLEKDIGELSVSQHNLSQEIIQHQAYLKRLRVEKKRAELKLQKQQHQLSEQLRASYMMGEKQSLKTLLNQESVSDVSRNMMYLKYINEAEMTLVETLLASFDKITETENKMIKETDNLNALKEKQHKTWERLTQQKEERSHLLESLNNDLASETAQLDILEANKKNLEIILKRLHSRNPPHRFSQLAHRLPWPTPGKIIHHYGDAIEHSDLHWNGALIAAPEGQHVYAISDGNVVFSDWLKGFGLLIIVDHGNNFMSLYGRNRSLYKKVGETVQAGDLLADVGLTGGYSKSGLYFEIRHGGRPENPEKWCDKRVKLKKMPS